MPEADKTKTSVSEGNSVGVGSSGALVFISHDSRDAELAEAFSKLLRAVTAGMLKSFRSSDKKGTEGIEFGDEWYKRLMEKLQAASDVVCLFTERSLGRPWILFEAGVAKGKLETPVHGIALGVPLSRVSTGPFYQFQNLDDSEDALTKLVLQLAKRIPGSEPDLDVVSTQVKVFKANVETILKKSSCKTTRDDAQTVDNPLAKFLEEIKGTVRDLPAKVADAVVEAGEPVRRRRLRRFHPRMIEEIMHMGGEPDDPIILLMMASVVRDEMPWFYEIAAEVYHAIKNGDPAAVEKEIKRLHRIRDFTLHGPMMEEFGFGSKEVHMFLMEFPHILERMANRSLEVKKTRHRERLGKPSTE
ncbi:MAG: toll/interleukin-1 receptor domain-containing protein [Planctomycetaceae bacterium]|nr:toll/interleukin-1 receptor domain-containing protein [Planctomycetaceae bacterium]